MARLIGGRNGPLLDALREAGLADDDTARAVIDIPAGGVVKAHVEKYCDERLLSVVQSLDGAQIIREERPDAGGSDG